jgi:hypothetical protein
MNGGWHKNDDENLDFFSQKNKGKFNNIVSGEYTSQAGKKKDMRKVKCFACHKFGHYAGKCLNKKKGENGMQLEVGVSEKTQMDEFCKKLEWTEFLLFSQMSLGTISMSSWLINSGATCHIIGAQELFGIFIKYDSYVHVELGMGTKHAVKGSGIVSFHMELGGVLRVTNLLWVPQIKRSVLSVSMIEKKGYDVTFQDG